MIFDSVIDRSRFELVVGAERDKSARDMPVGLEGGGHFLRSIASEIVRHFGSCYGTRASELESNRRELTGRRLIRGESIWSVG